MQTSYNINQAAKIAGQIMDIGPKRVVTVIADEEIPFGYGFVIGAKSGSGKLPDASTDTFLGVAGHKHTEQSYPFTASSGKYVANDEMNCVRQARVVVVTSGAVTNGAAAYLETSSGKFTTVNTDNIATGATFAETTSAAGIAELDINKP